MPRLIRKALEAAGIGELAEKVETGVDVVGTLAIVRLPEGMPRSDRSAVGAALLSSIPNVGGVFEQEGGIEGELRLRKLRHLAGSEQTLTTHRENGCVFKVDVARCYFSPRLSTERLRVALAAAAGERVLNMFAGVGPFSVPLAKKRKARVVSCELNTYACELHEENDRMNKVSSLIEVVNGDAMLLPEVTNPGFDRVVMPHPSQADRFLRVALQLTRPGGTIHYYRHLAGRDAAEAAQALREELDRLLPSGADYSARRVRDVGPRWVEMVADITVQPE